MPNQTAKIILEGTSWADTRGTALRLRENPRLVGQIGYNRYSTVISAVWGNFKDFPWGKGLVDFNPADETQAMANYNVWLRLIELQGSYNWILDRFHLTTQCYQRLYHDFHCDFKVLETRLMKLGFHLVYLTQSEPALMSAFQAQGSPADRLKIMEVLKTQELMGQLVERSILPTLSLDISGMEPRETDENIIDWLEEVGHYTPPEKTPVDKLFLPTC